MPNLYSVKRPPSKGTQTGDIYFVTSTKQTFVVLGDGRLFDLAGLLQISTGVVVGPQGEPGQSIVGPQGPKGDSITGPRGPQGPKGDSIVGPKGAAGRDGDRGKPGADSTVPGPAGKDGLSIVGPAGPQGPRGDIFIPNESELQAAVIAYRQKYARIQVALLEEISKNLKNRNASTRLHISNALNRVKKEAGL
jgi:hypothetical protein